MKSEKLEVVRGSGNIFRDLRHDHADLGRFTVDRLMSIVNRLGSRVEVKVKVRRARPVERRATIALSTRRPS
jgi:hypothetical protein